VSNNNRNGRESDKAEQLKLNGWQSCLPSTRHSMKRAAPGQPLRVYVLSHVVVILPGNNSLFNGAISENIKVVKPLHERNRLPVLLLIG
jgi:hypothetical protein